MNTSITRRRFLQLSAAGATSLSLTPSARTAEAAKSFSFILLGDLHFDRLEHHDMAWLEKNKGGDLGQIKNYSRITAEVMPRLFATVRETVTALNTASPANKVPFVLQAGDLVEGLCGTEELSVRQNQEALAFVREAKLGAPFLFTKGNHDVTGDGALPAFQHVFHPYLAQQAKAFQGPAKLDSGNYSFSHQNAQFFCFDAYDKQSLDWLEAALAKRQAQHCFVVIHPPVVPYGARSTWNLYSSAKDKPRREKLLELLGKQNAFVLGGHIHKFNTLTRTTPGGGKFVQLAVSSVVGSAETKPKDILSGLKEYTGDQIRVEPKHAPETEKARRAVYDTEREFVKSFEYADLPGHTVITINGSQVTAKIHAGITRDVWRTVDLTELLKA
ncbi:MAG: metallophosphoesterase [Verrucomicrobia bacterium]|jgi:3',5'-cyclic AMP phosphodiesterase CpdA|nr:metallophosphoesterase [Verrucomicrobiota bacterium]